MNVVYMAEQEQPVRRKVAIKIIKPGMDTRDVISRFEAERQALALMDHPNIAKVLDAGSTESGHPYFVMELVRGVPVTEYCNHNRLATHERLKLFIQICQAVAHAHRQGIIHRDIKPSNVMVTLYDGTPVPKIIDFGVAKATNQKLTERTLFTACNQMIGTPLYMSPEQAEMSGLEVDTRTDIYSLGVLLYELLIGTTPFDKETLKTVGFDEMRRIIREDDPGKPSGRISTLRGMATTVSEQRRTDPRRLTRLVAGDLDWIVMKALEKNRDHRYASALAFANDVRRFLGHKPIRARRPSALTRVRKWTRRHRSLATALLLLAVIGPLVVAGVVVVIRDREGNKVAEIVVPVGGTVIVTDVGNTPPGRQSAAGNSVAGDNSLPGIIPHPEKFPGVGRRQLVTTRPSSFLHHDWSLD